MLVRDIIITLYYTSRLEKSMVSASLIYTCMSLILGNSSLDTTTVYMQDVCLQNTKVLFTFILTQRLQLFCAFVSVFSVRACRYVYVHPSPSPYTLYIYGELLFFLP